MAPPSPPSATSLVAALSSLAVATVILARPRRSPGTLPLLGLCAALALWQLADYFSDRLGEPTWLLVAAFGTTALVPFLVSLVSAVLGSRGRARIVAVYALA